MLHHFLEEEDNHFDEIDDTSYLVFVYGSLKAGFGNNYHVRNSEFLGSFTTVDARFFMISLGAFPGVLEGGCGQIEGELYRVDTKTLNRLDGLEGNGHFYTRQEVEVYSYDEDDGLLVETAWMYVLNKHHLYGMSTDTVDTISSLEGFFNWTPTRNVEVICQYEDDEETTTYLIA